MGIPRSRRGGTNHSHNIRAAPMIYRDQVRSGTKKRFKIPQHTATEASMAESSRASSHLDTGGTSPRRVGKGGGETVSTGCLGLTTGV